MADEYFTVAEVRRAFPKLADGEAHTNEAIASARVDAEETIEHASACNVAFVARTATDRLDGRPLPLWLSHLRPRDITAVAIGGVDVEDLDVVRLDSLGRAAMVGGWPAGPGNVEITYLHGHDRPPGRIKRAAMLLAKHYLVGDEIHDRAVRVEAGEERLHLAPHEPTGIPEVDAAIRDHREAEALVW